MSSSTLPQSVYIPMSMHVSAINLDSLKSEMIIADVIPNPPRDSTDPRRRRTRRTKFMAWGCSSIRGVIGVEYWTGIKPDAG